MRGKKRTYRSRRQFSAHYDEEQGLTISATPELVEWLCDRFGVPPTAARSTHAPPPEPAPDWAAIFKETMSMLLEVAAIVSKPASGFAPKPPQA